jgi:hypothetical protein
MKRTVALAGVLALVLAAAGCGGGGSKTLSKAEYGAQLERICADYNAEVKKIGQPSSLAELGQKGPKLLDQFRAAVGKAEKLKAPAELKANADKFVSEAKQLIGVLSDLIDAAKKNDTAKITALGGKATALSKDSNTLSKSLGAPACAQG